MSSASRASSIGALSSEPMWSISIAIASAAMSTKPMCALTSAGGVGSGTVRAAVGGRRVVRATRLDHVGRETHDRQCGRADVGVRHAELLALGFETREL